jgi:hypothetical protein
MTVCHALDFDLVHGRSIDSVERAFTRRLDTIAEIRMLRGLHEYTATRLESPSTEERVVID